MSGKTMTPAEKQAGHRERQARLVSLLEEIEKKRWFRDHPDRGYFHPYGPKLKRLIRMLEEILGESGIPKATLPTCGRKERDNA